MKDDEIRERVRERLANRTLPGHQPLMEQRAPGQPFIVNGDALQDRCAVCDERATHMRYNLSSGALAFHHRCNKIWAEERIRRIVPAPEKLRERGGLLTKDPLSDVTRKERRALLAATFVGYVVTTTGLVPSQILALGITFSAIEQRSLLAAFGIAIVYFLVTFVIYAASDAMALRWALHVAKREWMDELEANPVVHLPDVRAPSLGLQLAMPTVAFLRWLWDLLVPALVGIYVAILVLWTALMR